MSVNTQCRQHQRQQQPQPHQVLDLAENALKGDMEKGFGNLSGKKSGEPDLEVHRASPLTLICRTMSAAAERHNELLMMPAQKKPSYLGNLTIANNCPTKGVEGHDEHQSEWEQKA